MALTAKKVYAILKRQISDMEAKLNSPVRYRGTVATADLLPLNPDIGDMYNIESKSVYGEAGMNVAWNGVVWDTMGAPIDMSLYLTKEEAELVIQRLVTEYLEKNPVKPGATAEQAQQIEQNKTDIASLKTETGSLKSDLDNLSSAIVDSGLIETKVILNNWVVGLCQPKASNPNAMTSIYPTEAYTEFRSMILSVSYGDEFYLNTIGIASAYTYLFVDDSGNIIDKVKISTASGGEDILDYKVVAPLGATKLLVNLYMSTVEHDISDYYVYSYSGASAKINLNEKFKSIDEEISSLSDRIGSTNHILCYGDSLTAGAGSDGHPDNKYPPELQRRVGNNFVVHNFGCGSEVCATIAWRNGGLAMYAQPFTIPSDTSGVEIDLWNSANYNVQPNIYHDNGLNPVSIGGVKGNITKISGTLNRCIFTRLESGDSVTLTRPTRIYTSGMEYKNGILVIWCGTNDSTEQGITTEKLVKRIVDNARTMIDYNGNLKYIVVGLTCKKYFSNVADVNVLLTKEFGSHFVDVRQYLLDYGLEDANVTPTDGDLEDVANGEIPRSLRSDDVHLRYISYPIIAEQIYRKGIELGYWQ